MSDFDSLRQYYKAQAKKQAVTIHPPSQNIFQIILIRHGEPDVEIKKMYSRSQVVEYDYSYYNSGVRRFDQSPINTAALPVDKVYHSTLRRAAHTAEQLFGDKAQLVPDSRFREFERDVIKDIGLHLPLKFWKVMSRLQWFLGYSSSEIESVKRARLRAKDNSAYLADKAREEKIVILVAHGLHNRYVARYLKSRGWSELFSSGYKFLGIQILAIERRAESPAGGIISLMFDV